jgi:phosphatidylglycerophosphate synthase
MITVSSACLGVLAGIVFASGWGFLAGLVALMSQVLDGVDGQFARLTGRESAAGAFLDSVLDRYPDGAMMIGLTVYILRITSEIPAALIVGLGFLGFVGSTLISYSTARAETLAFDLGKPTLASKGTRMTVMVLSGLGSFFWPLLPFVALCYLAVHPTVVVVKRIVRVYRLSSSQEAH